MTTPAAARIALPSLTDDGRARAAALQGHTQDSAGVGTVGFSSRGRVLIAAALPQATACAAALQPALQCLLLVPPGSGRGVAVAPGACLVEGRLVQLQGHLGEFSAGIECDGRTVNPAGLFATHDDYLDLVLDLVDPPVLAHEIPPPGYYAPRDPEALAHALDELRELVGEFEKPQYFRYDADICAHGRSGLAGCRRCIDACPTLAIRSLGDSIAVDAHLCQGAGSCASACPSGAIRYAYPGAGSLLNSVRAALAAYRTAGGRAPQVLFFDSATGPDAVARLAGRLPESVLPFQVEELGSVGMDSWLATLAYGARRVVLFTTRAIPRTVLRELSLQLSYAHAILGGMGYARECLKLALEGEREDILFETFGHGLPQPAIVPGGFMPFDEKRTTLGLAIDYLYTQAPEPRPMADLPDDAPFGAIEVDTGLCTLCMACVSVCPARALFAGNDRPALQFIENNCVQCGLCNAACPEDAIRLLPRIDYDPVRRRELRSLHEEQPFHCVRCGKPFATATVVQRMMQRLEGHWMFRDEQARRRIGMCQDCKALDIFEQEASPNVYDKPAADA